MPKTVEYIGTQDRWPELAVTGRPSSWFRGQAEERSDSEAALLLATGLFKRPDDTLTPADMVGVKGLVSGGGNLSATLDGSNRLATLTNNGTGRVLTITYTNATNLTVRDNGTPQAEVAIVLDGGQRLVSATGNF